MSRMLPLIVNLSILSVTAKNMLARGKAHHPSDSKAMATPRGVLRHPMHHLPDLEVGGKENASEEQAEQT